MKKLESLDVWKVGRKLSCAVYRLSGTPPLNRHFELRDQIRRAALSIPANLAEGYGLGTRRQLIRCTRIALGSAYELRTHLELAEELHLAPPSDGTEAIELCNRAVALLIGLLRGLESTARR